MPIRRFYFFLVLFVVVLNLALYWMATLPDRVGSSLKAAFQQTLQITPQITVHQTVVYQQLAPIAEFAVVTREQWTEYDYRNVLTVNQVALPFTEKKLTVRSAYRVKAGFDLHQPFQVETDRTGEQVRAQMPSAQILSVERLGDVRIESEDLWINRLTDAERTAAINALDQRARQDAEASDLKFQAEQQVTARLRQLIEKNGRQVTFQFLPAASASPKEVNK